MPFQFTLAAALRYQQSLEQRELLRLRSLLATRASLQHENQQITDVGVQLRTELDRSLRTAPVPAAEIGFCMARLDAVSGKQARLNSRLQELETAISGQIDCYQKHQQKCEVLLSLREVQLSGYRQQQRRREQLLLDDLHLMRRGRNPA